MESRKLELTIVLTAILLTGIVSAALTDAERTEFVDTHNRLRQAACPTAAAMAALTWSDQLEKLAQEAASKCKFEHSSDAFGENIYQGDASLAKPARITEKWHSEKPDYTYETGACKAVSPNSCGHYTQVMQDKAATIGCGIDKGCTGGHLVFCKYSAGNGRYEAGKPCSKCPTDLPQCANNLCYKDAKDISTTNPPACSPASGEPAVSVAQCSIIISSILVAMAALR